MSDVSTPTPEAPEAPAAVTTDDSTIVTDGSSILSTELLDAFLADAASILRKGIQAEDRSEVSKVKVAEYQFKCRAAIVIDGHPDWAGKSQTYRDAVNSRETPEFERAGWDRTRINRYRTAVRVAGMRAGWLERAIVDYCIPQLSEEVVKQIKWTEQGKNGSPALPAEAPKALADLVREQYDAAGLPAHAKYGGTKEEAGKVKRAAPVASLADLSKDVGKFSPLVVAQGVVDVAVALARSISEGEIAERGKVVTTMRAASEVLALAAKNADGRATAAEVETLARIIAVEKPATS